MGEINYNEVFGLDTTESVNETEVAGTSESPDTAGEKEQELADTADNESEGESAEAPEQTTEERSRYAAARRKAEAEKAEEIARIKAEAQKQIDEAVASLGINDPYSGKIIKNKAEYDIYIKQRSADQKKRLIEDSGISEDEFNAFVDNLPEVREAREAAEKARSAEAKAKEETAKAHIEDELKTIAQLDPTIKSIGDLAATENYKGVYDLVQKGYSLSDAYKLVNFDKIMQNTASQTKQAAINSANAKNHMTPTSSRGEGAVSVPNDIKESYRMFNPTATDAEISKHYNKYLRK